MSPRSSRVLLPLATAAALAGWAGCTAIAGIQNGVLADGGAGTNDVTVPGEGGTDGPPGGGSDGTLADGHPTSDGPGTTDSPSTLLDLGCSIIPNTTVTVDDLTAYDGSSQELTSQLFISHANTNDTIYVLGQRQAETAQFMLYEVNFTQQTSQPNAYTGVASTIRLLDVWSTGTTNEALASYYAGIAIEGTFDALEIVRLPYGALGGGSAWTLASSKTGSTIETGRLLHQPQTDDYLATVHTTASFQGYFVRAGQGDTNDGGTSQMLVESPSANFDVSRAPLVTIGGTTYAFVQQGLADGGTAIFSYPADVGDAGTVSGLNVGGALGLVLGAQVDPGNASNVEVVGANSSNGTSFQLWGGSVAPSSLSSLTLGSPPLTAGSTLSAFDAPMAQNAVEWMGPELLMTGSPGDNSGGVVFLWVGPTGRAVSRATTSGRLVSTSNQVVATAVQGISNVGEGSATLAVAWIERTTAAGGAKVDRILAAKVGCAPLPGGG
jgi:hypothetical protein